ncbi:MAG: hypothetical protein KKH41_04560 [Candidatus Thermoplasmatota archaeon]|nr:hypothetical protein [Euryarchaeota archaeon]MBU4144045.1 hypothetical protein [Candidatus Thermoplasmatota archaeon]MBU4591841.1 hypothetical protein [Candidatus Thermoplasmatota archaeon]
MNTHIGAGYGSEYHLMRYLGRYRDEFNRITMNALGGQSVEWLDFKHGKRENYKTRDSSKVVLPDREIIGLDFLDGTDYEHVRKEWAKFWPQSGKSQNWDAVAKIKIDQEVYWLLIEAKAHTGELRSDCGAISPESVRMIENALKETKRTFNIDVSDDWTQCYYQYANRLAALHFLQKHDIPAKLLYIYFLGDLNPRLASNSFCPQTESEWHPFIKAENEHLGITHEIKARHGIYEIFVEVSP